MPAAVRTHAAHPDGDGAAREDGGSISATSAAAAAASTPSTIRAAVRVRPLVDTESASADGAAEVIRVVTAAGRLTRHLESAYSLEVLQPAQASRTAGGGAPTRGGRPGPNSAAVQAKSYAFDVCAGPSTTQEELFAQLEIPALCEAALAGQVVTVFCFGQTGSGKTYTLSGRTLHADEVAGPDGPLVSEDGLQYQAAAYVARRLRELRHAGRRKSRHHRSSKSRSSNGTTEAGEGKREQREATAAAAVVAKCSIVELYQEALYDLLQPESEEPVRCRWSAAAQSFYVEGSMLVECRSAEDFTLVLREGQRNRQRGSHALNRDSSRSHVVFTIFLEVHDGDDNSPGSADSAAPPSQAQRGEEERKREAGGGGVRYGRLVFVDLAGSERLKKSQSSSGAETGSINKSLFTLGRVLELLSAPASPPDEGAAPAKSAPFIPYRSSILTQLLMQSLDGHGRTLMVACVSPSATHLDESMRTLHYAQRARHIRTTPLVHVDAATQARMALEETVKALRAENAMLRRALQLPPAGALTEGDVQQQMAQLRLGGMAAAPGPSQEPQVAARGARPPPPPTTATASTASRGRAKSSPVPMKPITADAPKGKIGAVGATPPAAARAPKRTPASTRPALPPSPSAGPSASSPGDEEEAPNSGSGGVADGTGGGGAVNILAMLDALPDTRPAPS